MLDEQLQKIQIFQKKTKVTKNMSDETDFIQEKKKNMKHMRPLHT